MQTLLKSAALAALATLALAAPALACDDPNCPHGGGKPPKISA